MTNRAERRRIIHNSATGRSAILTAGPKVEAPPSKCRAELPPIVEGEHLWVVMTMYQMRHPERMATEVWHLDLENLLTTDGPICYWCEEPYREDVGACTGYRSHPDD